MKTKALIQDYRDHIIAGSTVILILLVLAYVSIPSTLILLGATFGALFLPKKSIGATGILLLTILSFSILFQGNDSDLTSNLSQIVLGLLFAATIKSMKDSYSSDSEEEKEDNSNVVENKFIEKRRQASKQSPHAKTKDEKKPTQQKTQVEVFVNEPPSNVKRTVNESQNRAKHIAVKRKRRKIQL